MSAPVLVVVRLGADHRISGWAAVPRAARDWDLVLSPYEEVPDLDRFEPDAVLPAEGGKWEGLHRIFAERPELLEGRALLWLPDDDVEADPAAVARLFRLARDHDLALSQPALTPDSAFSHFVTVRHPLTTLRYTNFVELMAPLMTPALWRAAAPMMQGRAGAKGLDFLWTGLVPSPRRERIAVIDAAPVSHRRPLGAELAPAMARLGRDLEEERAGLLARHPCAARPRSRSLGGPGVLGRGPLSRFALTLGGALTVALHPALWRAASLRRAAKTLAAQLTRSDDAL